MSEVGTSLYRAMLVGSERAAGGVELAHKVWDGTPWMVDIYTGPTGGDRDRKMRLWCRDNLGDCADPFGGRPGRWWRGLATINGWTWYGFSEQFDMGAFVAAWPAPAEVAL